MFNPAEHFIELKGKKYLQVMWRLVWFREEHPNYTIDTQLISHEPTTGAAVFRATIADDKGATLATAHGSETKRDFGDYLEKAETKAVGRALAYLGYGTQFAPELDEGERIVDSPADIKSKPNTTNAATCERCFKTITAVIGKDGNEIKAPDVVAASKLRFKGACYCADCQREIKLSTPKAGK